MTIEERAARLYCAYHNIDPLGVTENWNTNLSVILKQFNDLQLKLHFLKQAESTK